MFEHGGVWLPDGEQHLVGWMDTKQQWYQGKLTYQFHKLKKALELTTGRRAAIDVGAHVGLWSMWLGRSFQFVAAFEPVARHVDCFRRNCSDLGNVHVFEFALGERSGYTTMHKGRDSTGDTFPEPHAQTGNIPVRVFDEISELSVKDCNVDLVKLDCEGFELFALRGMEKMLKRCQPTVVVEQKPGKAEKYGLGRTDAVTYLKSLGATKRFEISGDYFMTF